MSFDSLIDGVAECGGRGVDESADLDAAHGSVGGDLSLAASMVAGYKNADVGDSSDVVSVCTVSTLQGGSSRTGRRSHQRRRQKQTRASDDAPVKQLLSGSHSEVAGCADSGRTVVHTGVQCDLLVRNEIEQLEETNQRLRMKLNEVRLKLVATRGDLVSLKRLQGGHSDDEWEKFASEGGFTDSESDDPATSIQHDSDGKTVIEEKQEDSEAESGSEQSLHRRNFGDQDDDSNGSELPSNVEIGDVVEIVDLTSDKGQAINGFYGKVIKWDAATGRFGVSVAGHVYALRPESLVMGMKKDEMSDTDEELLLGLTPTSSGIRSLPWHERMQRLGYLRSGEASSSSNSHNADGSQPPHSE